MRRALFFLLTLNSGTVLASADCPEAFRRVFSEAYSSKACNYNSIKCSVNVLKVADELQAMGVDLSKAEVIVIVKEYQKRVGIPMDGHLVPSNAISRASQWLHHVVLKVDGKIYDLEAGAEGLAPREYLARMFPDRPEQVGRADKIKVRVLGLAEYRELTGPFNYGDSIRRLTSYTDTPDFPHTLRPYSQIIDGPTGNP